MSAQQNLPNLASGHGIATFSGETLLDVWFPEPILGITQGANNSKISAALTELAGVDEVRKVRREVISIEIDLKVAPTSAADAYLRLHLLSHRLIKPHGAVMDGIFGLLANVVWTSAGPCAVEGFELIRGALRNKYGHVTVYGVDKFPRMVD